MLKHDDGELGRRLRRLRNERGLVVRDVATACTLPYSALGSYERGERAIPATALALLCAFYDVPVTEVLGDGPAATPRPADPSDRLRVPFDLAGLRRARSKEAKTAAEVVAAIRERRSTVRPSDGVFLIRRDDLFTIGAVVGLSVEALVEKLRTEGALRHPKGRPTKSAPRGP
ncbi:MAG: helix-turn-helix domain-containing protein [Acidimicrobiales bacterium]